MSTVITVQTDTRAEAEAWLDKLRILGLLPLGSGRPFEVTGRGGRWMVRVEPAGRADEGTHLQS